MRWICVCMLLIAGAANGDGFTVPGTVEAFEQTDLYAKVAGYVSAVNADIGDEVKAGQVLAVIDAPEIGKELLEAKAMLVARQRGAEASTAAVQQAKSALEVARRNVDRYKADAQFQQTTLKRQQELFSGKAITDQQLDDARNRATTADAELAVAQAKAGAAEADVLGAQANQGLAAAQVSVAEAAIGRIETQEQYLKIVAPYDGTISRRLVNRGDLVQAATAARTAPMFTVHRVDTVRVFCDVPESQAAGIKKDLPVTVKLYGGAEAIEAKVTRLAGSLNPETRTLRTEIDLPNPAGKLLPGAYAQITFTAAGK